VGGVAQRRDARGQHGAVDVRAVLEQQRAGLAEALARPRREGERKPAVLVGVLDGRALRRRRRRHAVCQQGQGQGQRDARWPLARTISSARRMRLRSPCAAARSSIVAAAPTSAAAAPLVLWRDMAGAAAPAALSGAGRTRRRARLPRTQQRHHQRGCCTGCRDRSESRQETAAAGAACCVSMRRVQVLNTWKKLATADSSAKRVLNFKKLPTSSPHICWSAQTQNGQGAKSTIAAACVWRWPAVGDPTAQRAELSVGLSAIDTGYP
jgi:hypothetical protein